MKLTNSIFIASNIIGVILFSYFVLSIKNQMELEERVNPDGIDGVTFFYSAVPVASICIIYCIVWCGISLITRNKQGLLAVSGVILAWVITVLVLRVM